MSALQNFTLNPKTGVVTITNLDGDVTTVPHQALMPMVMSAGAEIARFQNSDASKIAEWVRGAGAAKSKEEIAAALESGDWSDK